MNRILTAAAPMLAGAAVLATPALADDARTVAEVRMTPLLEEFNLPYEVQPALMPYYLCRNSQLGVAVFDEEGKLLNPAGNPGDCSDVRKEAAAKTVRMLDDLQLGRNRGERRAYAEHVLAKIDALEAPAGT